MEPDLVRTPATVILLGLAACSGPPAPGPTGLELEVVEGPTLAMSTDPRVPLAGTLTVATSHPTTLTVEVEDWSLGFSGRTTVHAVDLIGFHADTTHAITLSLTAEDGTSVSAGLTAVTPPLPADMPDLTVLTRAPERMAPGVNLFVVPGATAEHAYILLVDDAGHVIWFLQLDEPATHVTRTAAGHFLFVSGRRALREVDVHGVSQRDFVTPSAPVAGTPIDLLAVHHDVVELASGNLATLGIELRDEPAYPSSELVAALPPTPATVAYDLAVELDPSGAIVERFAMADLLDPLRIGHQSVSGTYWTEFLEAETRDWGHANAIVYRAEDDTYLVSVRHQDAVVQLDRASGTVDWILAPPRNWPAALEPLLLHPGSADTTHPYHQHAPTWTDAGTLLMFDNGNHQASAYEVPVPQDQIDSRALELAIDPVAMTFTEVWSWDALEEPNFANGMGSALRMDNGNTVITYGFIGILGGGVPDHTGRVVEVTPDGEVVFDLGSEPSPIYRALRIPLYADGTSYAPHD